jgi:hypothetical protein
MAESPAGQQRVLSKLGVLYSLLLELPYFDPIRFHVIDPMYNSLFGTTKLMMQIWVKHGIRDSQSFATISQQ